MQKKLKFLFGMTLIYLLATACATRDSRVKVVGGVEVSKSKDPGARLIEQATIWIGTVHIDGHCTATLIAPKVLLTAAHCIYGTGRKPVDSKYWAKLPSGRVEFTMKNIDVHEEYVGPWGDYVRNDIALIRLPSAVPDAYSPAGLPSPNETLTSVRTSGTNIISNGQKITAAGFGRPTRKIRKSGTLRMADTELYAIDPVGQRLFVSDTDSAHCKGDSGGPNYVFQGKGLVTLGPTSMGTCDKSWEISVDGTRQTEEIFIGVITDVRPHYAWIKSKLPSADFQSIHFARLNFEPATNARDPKVKFGVLTYERELISVVTGSIEQEGGAHKYPPIAVPDPEKPTNTSNCEKPCHRPDVAGGKKACASGCTSVGQGCFDFKIKCVRVP